MRPAPYKYIYAMYEDMHRKDGHRAAMIYALKLV